MCSVVGCALHFQAARSIYILTRVIRIASFIGEGGKLVLWRGESNQCSTNAKKNVINKNDNYIIIIIVYSVQN